MTDYFRMRITTEVSPYSDYALPQVHTVEYTGNGTSSMVKRTIAATTGGVSGGFLAAPVMLMVKNTGATYTARVAYTSTLGGDRQDVAPGEVIVLTDLASATVTFTGVTGTATLEVTAVET